MFQVTQVIRSRQKRQAGRKHNPVKQVPLFLSAGLSLFLVVSGLVAAMFYSALTKDLPAIETLPALLDPPDGYLLHPTRLYDRTATHLIASLEHPAAVNRQYLELPAIFTNQFALQDESDTIPISLILATVAASDPLFWQHEGVQPANSLHPNSSSLAQKLVDDLLLWNETPGWQRNLRQRILATQLTSQYGRQKILTWYLNSARYGSMIYGVDAAAWVYFGKSASRLNLAESAVLAAVAQAPALNPHNSPTIALQRGKTVLEALLEREMITSTEFQDALQTDIEFSSKIENQSVQIAPAFTRLVLDQLSTRINLDRIERGGLKIITSLDYDLQLQADCTLATQINRLQGNLVEIKTSDGQDCQAARLLPTLSTIPSTLPDELSTSALILDPRHGHILALADLVTQKSPASPAFQLPSLLEHPAGSIVTPWIYLAGFTRGLSPASLLWDIPSLTLTTSEQEENYSYHGPIRLRSALANDYLIPAKTVLDQVGVENVLTIASPMGLSLLFAPIQDKASSFLDPTQVRIIELSQAYGVLANQGIFTGLPADPKQPGTTKLLPVIVLGVSEVNGRIWIGDPYLSEDPSLISRPVISPQLAYLVTDILSDENARWPSLGHPNPLEIGRPVAAKLGVSSSNHDLWISGYTSDWVVSAWMGCASQEPICDLPSASVTGIWHSLMQFTSRNSPSQAWEKPAGILTIDVCTPSGLLPGKDCPSIVTEVFLESNIPTQTDTLYKKLQVNRETGRLATVFTPPELIENRIYMILPPDAREWANNAGIQLPPEDYDVIQSVFSQDETVASISSPLMFAYVRNQVEIMGTASGSDFSSYRLRFGKGVYPQEWLEIGAESQIPIKNDVLGIWDTAELSGYYTIQLLVEQQEQQIKTAILQVTVDNIAPEIESTYPEPEQVVTPSLDNLITVQVQASDNLMIDTVTIYIDGQLMSILRQSPYAVTWQSSVGQHLLKVIVTDMAGNRVEKTVEFSVSKK